MKHTILHKDASAADTFRYELGVARDLDLQLRNEHRRHGGDTERYQRLHRRWVDATSNVVMELLAAAVVSSDELDAAEAMLHGMRLAVPQDEMGG